MRKRQLRGHTPKSLRDQSGSFAVALQSHFVTKAAASRPHSKGASPLSLNVRVPVDFEIVGYINAIRLKPHYGLVKSGRRAALEPAG